MQASQLTFGVAAALLRRWPSSPSQMAAAWMTPSPMRSYGALQQPSRFVLARGEDAGAIDCALQHTPGLARSAAASGVLQGGTWVARTTIQGNCCKGRPHARGG